MTKSMRVEPAVGSTMSSISSTGSRPRPATDARVDSPIISRLHGRQDDDRAARSPDPPLRHHRDRKRQLALQKPTDDHIPTRARAVSATPTSSDGASATARTRRSRGSKLDADGGSNLQAD